MTDLEELNRRIDKFEELNKRIARVNADFLTSLISDLQKIIKATSALSNRITDWRSKSP